MKKRTVSLILVFLLSFSMTSFGEVSHTKISIDNEYVQFNEELGFPFVDGNYRTQVPFRATMEFFGATVGWNSETQTAIAEKDGIRIEVPIGEMYIFKNGEKIENDTAALIKNGRTYLPIRVVLEAFGAKVDWDGENKCVLVDSNKVEVKVHFIDVGQGDAIFIQYEDFHALIDAGDNSSEETVVNYLTEQGVDDLELFIATHSHADHIGGADAVLNTFDAEFIVDCEWLSDTETFVDYKNAMIKNSSDTRTVYRTNDSDIIIEINADGTQPKYGKDYEDGDMIIKIIANNEDEDVNNSSTVVLLDILDTEFLFTGDLEEEGEKALLDKFTDIEVLKVGHHGSNSSTCDEFLNAIKPEYGIISCGVDNKYNHPHTETIDKLNNANVEIFRTDEQGTIICTTDGKNLSWNTDPTNSTENNDTNNDSNADLTVNVDNSEELENSDTNNSESTSSTSGIRVMFSINEIYNNSVGNEWHSYLKYGDINLYSSHYDNVIFISDNEDISFEAIVYEYDESSSDFGYATFTIPYSEITKGGTHTYKKEITITEDRGRYSGNSAKFEFVLTITPK